VPGLGKAGVDDVALVLDAARAEDEASGFVAADVDEEGRLGFHSERSIGYAGAFPEPVVDGPASELIGPGGAVLAIAARRFSSSVFILAAFSALSSAGSHWNDTSARSAQRAYSASRASFVRVGMCFFRRSLNCSLLSSKRGIRNPMVPGIVRLAVYRAFDSRGANGAELNQFSGMICSLGSSFTCKEGQVLAHKVHDGIRGEKGLTIMSVGASQYGRGFRASAGKRL
jgi:hypothetical protein